MRPPVVSATHFNSRIRSPALCHLSSGCLARHRRTMWSRVGGVSCCSVAICGRLAFENRRHGARGTAAIERRTAGDHLVDDGAEGEDVAAVIGLPPFDLLRGHVSNGSNDGALLRERCAARVGNRGTVFRDAEVHQLGAGARQHDVRGLHVPVHDPVAMRVIERIGHLDRALKRAIKRQRRFREACREGIPLEVLHDDEIDAIAGADVVQRADVRVSERCAGLCLAAEALAQARIDRRRWAAES